jgi:hypothetical protein
MDNNDSHYKLKHSIEEDDGIFTVFIAETSQLRNINTLQKMQIPISKIELFFYVSDVDIDDKNNRQNKETVLLPVRILKVHHREL